MQSTTHTSRESLRLRSLFVSLTLFALSTEAMIYQKTINLSNDDSSYFAVFQRFRFLSGGTAHIDLQLSKTNITGHFMFCSSGEVDKINGGYNSADDLCHHFDEVSCVYKRPLIDGSFNDVINVTRKDQYYLFIENCAKDDFTAKIDYTLLNPGGQHLDYGFIPLLEMYEVMFALSVTLTTMWIFNWLWFRKNPLIKLHMLFSFVLLMKLGDTYFEHYYWHYISEHGLQPNWLEQTKTVAVDGFYNFFSYLVLMLFAKGYSVTTCDLGYAQVSNNSMLIFLLSGAFMLFTLYGGYLLFPLLLLYFSTFRIIITSAQGLIFALYQQINYLQTINFAGSNIAFTQKLLMLKSFKTLVKIYFIIHVGINVVGTFIYFYIPWILYLLRESIDLLLIAGLVFLLRQRNFARENDLENARLVESALRNSQVVSRGGFQELTPLPSGAEYFTTDELPHLRAIAMPTPCDSAPLLMLASRRISEVPLNSPTHTAILSDDRTNDEPTTNILSSQNARAALLSDA
eukprot:TRINITY_DN4961_c0_g1_i4.p1 TRINITY_DN4961_c0_g1~~TRINITY_DN4961_c0_g1_i4.p1  ORF type:complete len:515 (+),score=100.99 TRINITY_DN4961_c0_g1_i4:43-1587(+)